MKKKMLAILLAIALLSSVATVVVDAYEENYAVTDNSYTTEDGVTTYFVTVLYYNNQNCEKCKSYLVPVKEATGTSTLSASDAQNKAMATAKAAWEAAYTEHFNSCCRCAICAASFNNVNDYNAHMDEMHTVKFYCTFTDCPYNLGNNGGKLYFSTEEALIRHMEYAHPITINVKASTSVDYRSKVIVTATASGVPGEYYLAIYEGNTLREKGKNSIVSYTPKDSNGNPLELKNDITLDVKVVDKNGIVQKDSKGNNLTERMVIRVNSGFFDKFIAFFRGLFGMLPTVEIGP